MAFQLSEADRKLSALDNANIANPSAANSAALDTELTRQQPPTDLNAVNNLNPAQKNAGVPMSDRQKNFSKGLSNFSQNVVDFVTGDSEGGGAVEFGKDYVRSGKEAGEATADALYGVSQDVKDYANDNALGTPGIDFNAGRDYSINYLERPDGTRAYTQEDTAPGALGDSQLNYAGRNPTQEYAEAERIRAQTRKDNTPQGQPGAGIVIPETNEQSALDKRRAALQRDFDSDTGSAQDRNRAYRGLQLLNDQDRFETAADQSGENANTYASQQANSANIRAQAQTQQGRAARLASLAQAAKTLNELKGSLTPQQEQQAKAGLAAYEMNPSPDLAKQINVSLGFQMLPELTVENNAEGGLIESFADGGYVDPTAQRTQGTGAVGSAGAMGGKQASMQRYQQYASKAQEMNLPLLGYKEFAAMTAEPKGYAMGGMVGGGALAGETVLGYADGGTVDVSGEQVIDPNPNAPTDSIPAVIDGHRPAALDSGEFVIPTDVVMYYGTDKLNKMIQKARNPDGGKQQQSTALGGAPAG